MHVACLEGCECHGKVLLELLQLILVVALHILTRTLKPYTLCVDGAEGVLESTNQLVATVDLGSGGGVWCRVVACGVVWCGVGSV